MLLPNIILCAVKIEFLTSMHFVIDNVYVCSFFFFFYFFLVMSNKSKQSLSIAFCTLDASKMHFIRSLQNFRILMTCIRVCGFAPFETLVQISLLVSCVAYSLRKWYNYQFIGPLVLYIQCIVWSNDSVQQLNTCHRTKEIHKYSMVWFVSLHAKEVQQKQIIYVYFFLNTE